MRSAMGGVLALCLKYLHRHPLELAHLPARVLGDLAAYARWEAEANGDDA